MWIILFCPLQEKVSALENQANQLSLQATQECERLAKDRTLTVQMLQKVSTAQPAEQILVSMLNDNSSFSSLSGSKMLHVIIFSMYCVHANNDMLGDQQLSLCLYLFIYCLFILSIYWSDSTCWSELSVCLSAGEGEAVSSGEEIPQPDRREELPKVPHSHERGERNTELLCVNVNPNNLSSLTSFISLTASDYLR